MFVTKKSQFLSVLFVLALLVTTAFYVADAKMVDGKWQPIRSTKDPFDPSIPNPPKYVQPLGACEVPYLSLKTIKKELRKRNAVCGDACVKKEDYQRLLIERINDWTPVMTDEELEAALAKEGIEAAPAAAAVDAPSASQEAAAEL